MQNAKRMVLVDERMLDWKKPIAQKAKTILHHELRDDLQNNTLPDDQKAKLYQQFLNRFLHTKDKIPEQPIIKQEVESLEKKNTRKRPAAKPTRKSKRKLKKAIEWEEW